MHSLWTFTFRLDRILIGSFFDSWDILREQEKGKGVFADQETIKWMVVKHLFDAGVHLGVFCPQIYSMPQSHFGR